MALGMSLTEADDTGYRGTNEGSKMAGNAALWYDGDLVIDPEFGTSGLNLLAGGFRDDFYGDFYDCHDDAYVWSSSENGSEARLRHLSYDNTKVSRFDYSKDYALSVRCVRD
jgi:uncharacterized protein (TIGR02145 family)